jgi:Uma2 family endonuclease
MASLPNPKRVTYEEWLNMPIVEDATEEVIDGEIIIMPPAKLPHARITANLLRALLNQFDGDRFDALTGSFGLVIRKQPLTCRNPDLAVFDRDTGVEESGYYHSAPQLAVEVLSPSETRLRKERKLRDYESIGTPEVWVIDPPARAVEILQLQAGRLCTTPVLREGILKPMALPHVQIDIAQIWPH